MHYIYIYIYNAIYIYIYIYIYKTHYIYIYLYNALYIYIYIYKTHYIYIYIYISCCATCTYFLNSFSLSVSIIHRGWSSGLHPVSVQSCCRYVLAGRPTLVHPWEEVHGRTSLMNPSLLLQQCPACLVRLIWMVFEMAVHLLFCGMLLPVIYLT